MSLIGFTFNSSSQLDALNTLASWIAAVATIALACIALLARNDWEKN